MTRLDRFVKRLGSYRRYLNNKHSVTNFVLDTLDFLAIDYKKFSELLDIAKETGRIKNVIYKDLKKVVKSFEANPLVNILTEAFRDTKPENVPINPPSMTDDPVIKKVYQEFSDVPLVVGFDLEGYRVFVDADLYQTIKGWLSLPTHVPVIGKIWAKLRGRSVIYNPHKKMIDTYSGGKRIASIPTEMMEETKKSFVSQLQNIL